MPANDILISTKFHLPSARTDFIPRLQLFQLLEQGLHQPLALISAPPGFGKTTLVASWLQSTVVDNHLSISWLSLDEGDNTTGMFWRYFVAAIQQSQPKVGLTAQEMLAAPALPDLHSILGILINELAELAAPLLIVLDDYHFVRSPDVHNNLIFFLDHMPLDVHLMVLTREDPPLALARRRARHQMVEIRAADLRFDAHETSGFLNDIRNLALTSEQIALLEQRTEGWVAGLEMAALSLQGRDAGTFFESFSGDNRYVADYLIEEVLERQDETVREFLLKTSILEHLSVPLCTALIGNPTGIRATLDHLEHANLFLIPLDNHREWYRYHHLFAELLYQRLSEAYSIDEIAALRRSASEWYASQENIPAAVRQARQIPDMVRAMELLEQHAGVFFANNTIPQLVELTRDLPAEQLQGYPILCMAIAWAALAIGDTPARWLELIERHYGYSADAALGEDPLDPATRTALLEVVIVRQQGVFEAHDPNKQARLLAIQRQLDALPDEQRFLLNTAFSLRPVVQFNLGLDAEQAGDAGLAAQHFMATIDLARQTQNYHLHLLSLGHLANVQISQAHLHAACQTHEQALSSHTPASVSPFVALAHAGLSAVHYEWCNLAIVEQHLDQGLTIARLWNNWESLVPLTLTSARLEHRRGNVQAALSSLDDLKTSPFEGALLPVEVYAALLRASHADQASASAWLAAKVTPPVLEVNVFNEAFLLDVARLFISLHRLDDAIALAGKIISFAENGKRTHPLIQAKVILAKAFSLSGNSKDADSNLGAALRLAMPEKYLSSFVDEGEPIRELLNSIKGKISPELRVYAAQILTAFSGGGKKYVERATGIGSDLSEREKEILLLIDEGLSNQEIAERLFITISTVKTHVGNIFNKLGVASRTQALARAEDLGLLPGK